jgi:hypothetical protein
MIEGTFSFLLLLFASPQQIVSNHLEGYWLVTIDNTDQVREWNRIYYFEKCARPDRKSYECGGHFGWAEFDGVYLNLYDKNYLSYGVVAGKQSNSEKRKLFLNDIKYDFILNTNQKVLKILELDSDKTVMEMRKVSKSELKKNEKN